MLSLRRGDRPFKRLFARPDGSLTGVNTDAPAFLARLREDSDYDRPGQSVVILVQWCAAPAAVGSSARRVRS